MKDNEINRAKGGCALEPSHLNIGACVSSLQSRNFRTQLAPIKRYHTGKESCRSPGLLSAPVQGWGWRAASLQSTSLLDVFSIYSLTSFRFVEAAELFACLRHKSCAVLGLCLVQQAEQLLKTQLVSEWPVTICPQRGCHHCCFLSHLVTALILLFAPLGTAPRATMVGNSYLYIHLSLTQKWESCSSPHPSYRDKDLVRLLLLSMLGKAQVSTLPCWSLPLCSAWLPKSAVMVCLAACSIFGLRWGIDKSLCSG